MIDLAPEMAELWASLGGGAPGRAQVLQVAAARRGEGTSTVARELALFAARQAGRTVWLLDLDLLASPQHAHIAAHPGRYGALGDPAAATPDGSCFFAVLPRATTKAGEPWPDAAYLSAQRLGGSRLWVTRFRRDLLRAGQTVHVLSSPDYWTALRRQVDLVIVDAPALERSQAAVTLAPFVDETVLVVAADRSEVRPPAMLRDALAAAGGSVAGLFVNRLSAAPPPFMRSASP
jgi:hypothetical protein